MNPINAGVGLGHLSGEFDMTFRAAHAFREAGRLVGDASYSASFGALYTNSAASGAVSRALDVLGSLGDGLSSSPGQLRSVYTDVHAGRRALIEVGARLVKAPDDAAVGVANIKRLDRAKQILQRSASSAMSDARQLGTLTARRLSETADEITRALSKPFNPYL